MGVAIEAGAYGAKMIGGGFGGSVLALMPAERAPAVRAALAGASRARLDSPGVPRSHPRAGRPPARVDRWRRLQAVGRCADVRPAPLDVRNRTYSRHLVGR